MERHYVDALRTGDELQVKKLYYAFRQACNGLCGKYGVSPDDAADIYQDCFLIMRDHAISGKLYTVKSSFKTYLLGVAKNLIFNKLKTNALRRTFDAGQIGEDESVDSEDSLTEEQRIFTLSFGELGENCRELLTMALYRGLTNEEITQIRSYENESVTRSHKSRCIKKLKDIVNRNRNKWTDKNS
ncbi:sigma-70 family RNA polymerase sigma factor [Allomuricauda taeanensis]|uniref:RNA polymerase sigma factor n=1 Tax=Flagellimonas taeanensis TaxID=1005926 RepID=UPI002E7AC3C7|nr:sigma-70 family RNA polymerase sigma factor [Allomuricauda taeanensis]MEE1963595.1 sigma-70 family RNA polymerase sigma factor [Allomuricauda taeanensis]